MAVVLLVRGTILHLRKVGAGDAARCGVRETNVKLIRFSQAQNSLHDIDSALRAEADSHDYIW